MGRQLRRVPLDFDWPLNKPWKGFLNPWYAHSYSCPTCYSTKTGSSTGYGPYAQHLYEAWYGYVPFYPPIPFSRRTPGVMDFATRNVTRSPEYHGGTDALMIEREADRLLQLWNGSLCHHLNQTDVDALTDAGRLMDFTHTFDPVNRWQPKTPSYRPTAKEVNEWSIQGFGHDSINCMVVIKARCERAHEPCYCPACDGEGSLWDSAEAEAAAEAWTSTEPPAGDGWQMWETVSEGSPISPVFATPEELARYLTDNPWGVDKDTTYAQWLKFIKDDGWAVSMVMHDGILESGVQAATHEENV